MQKEIADAFADPELTARVGAVDAPHPRQHRCRAHAGGGAMGDRSRGIRRRASPRAPLRAFSEAFDRWRQLYDGARAQLMEANRRSEMHGLSAAERREAKIQQAQANEQLALLETRHGDRRLGLLHLPLSRDRRLSARLQLSAPAALCLCAGRRRRRVQRPPICSALASSPLPSSARAA